MQPHRNLQLLLLLSTTSLLSVQQTRLIDLRFEWASSEVKEKKQQHMQNVSLLPFSETRSKKERQGKTKKNNNGVVISKLDILVEIQKFSTASRYIIMT